MSGAANLPLPALGPPGAGGHSPAEEFTDPRVRRTRELLQQSLAALLATREFERISVQDITDSATVNRATFYAHYPDKFALLNCLVATRFQALLAARGVVFDGTCFYALHGIVLGACDYLAETLPHCPQRSPATLADAADHASDRHMEPHLEAAVVNVLQQMILHGLALHPPPSGLPPRLVASTVGWAIYGAAREWAHTPDRIPSEAIAPVIVGMVLPLLGPLPQPGEGEDREVPAP